MIISSMVVMFAGGGLIFEQNQTTTQTPSPSTPPATSPATGSTATQATPVLPK